MPQPAQGGAPLVIERVPLASLHADPANVNTHPEQNLSAIAGSLRQFGQVEPLIVQKSTGKVIGGNGRLAVMLKDGQTEADVVRLDIDDTRAAALGIALNRTAKTSVFDDGALAKLLESLPKELRADTGFTEKDMGELLASLAGPVVEDEAPEPLPDPVSKRGDLWLMGGHRLLCGDSTRRESVERLMDGRRCVLSFTSPPYANQRTYTKEGDLSTEYLSRFIAAAAPFVDVFAVNLGLARHGGKLDRYWDDYILSAERAGLGLLSWNVWSREGMQMSIGQATAMFPIQHEWILVFGEKPVELIPTVPNKSAGHVGNSTDRQADGSMSEAKRVTIRPNRELGTIVTIAQVKANEDHPAQFPVKLAATYIEAFTGDVYEPFSGSGTTIIASEQLGRRCFAIEIEPRYVDVAVRRWQKLTGKSATHADTGKTWAETAAERGVKVE